MSSAIAVVSSSRPVRTIRRDIIRTGSILLLTLSHWFGLFYSRVAYSFTGPWFPFVSTEQPDHQIWGAMIRILEFPLGTVVRAVGIGEGEVLDIAQLLSAPIWGFALFFGGLWVIRKLRG